jgi:hypothetical protein
MFGPSGVSMDINVRSAYSERHVPQIQLSLESPPGPSADNLLLCVISASGFV